MYVRVEVYPGAKKEKITVVSENRLELSIKEPAERNLANHRMKEMVALHYTVTVDQVRIILGHHSQRKIISVDSD